MTRVPRKQAYDPPQQQEEEDGEGMEDGEPREGGGRGLAAYDATDDIQDIDRRLNALQQFLTAAKAPR